MNPALDPPHVDLNSALALGLVTITLRLLRSLIIINLPVLILFLICGKRLRGLNTAGTARICEGRCDCMGALSDIRPVHKSMYVSRYP